MTAPRTTRRLPLVATVIETNHGSMDDVIAAIRAHSETLKRLAELAAEGVEPPKLERREIK